jgi:hypothetical protein
MRRLLAIGLLCLLPHTSAWAFDFNRYHSVAEIDQYMQATAAKHPKLLSYVKMGQSELGRTVAYMVVAKKNPKHLPALYVNGTHHGNEKSSTESTLALLNHIVTNPNDPIVTKILDRYALYLQPLVNPDGHLANTRSDVWGRDPNRDYSYSERSDADSFKTKSTQLVKGLVEQIKPRAAVAFHSGMEGVLWPGCHSSEATADQDLFHELSKQAATTMGFKTYQQSFFDYATTGEFIDYAYWKYRTLAVTIEVSQLPTPAPAQLNAVVANSVRGVLSFFDAYITRELKTQTVTPSALSPLTRRFVMNDRLKRQGDLSGNL